MSQNTLALNRPVTALNALTKGMPGNLDSVAPEDVATMGWNVLREDLNLPLAVLRQSAVEHNAKWMHAYVASHNGRLSPHGKTTMSPELFAQQLEDGAWAITVANSHQIQVARHFGVNRIFLANQLVGRQAIKYVLNELRDSPEFDFYCIVDSVENVRQLATAVSGMDIGRPLQVLVEVGIPLGRSGSRNTEDALAVARSVHAHQPYLSLRGVEGFEGIISHPNHDERVKKIRNFLARMCEVAEHCDNEQLFGEGMVILSAGGSAYFDIVLEELNKAKLRRASTVLTRSGCYISHDAKKYSEALYDLALRAGDRAPSGESLKPALEVWAYVHSRPEPDRVIVGMGKRDISYDDPPIAQSWYRPGESARVLAFSKDDNYEITQLNDQHAYLRVPVDSPLAVGDMVQFGISHPCLTFDKWRAMCLVNDKYDVVGAVTTYF